MQDDVLCKQCGGIASFDPYFKKYVCSSCGTAFKKEEKKVSGAKLAVSVTCPHCDRTFSLPSDELDALLSPFHSKEFEERLMEQRKVLHAEHEKREAEIRKEYEEQIAYYKDFKTRQSTKMVGESLEQFCLTEFEKVRMCGFETAYFEKDNEVKEGSKGDFIFRDFTPDGNEYVSIMFEMKNEMETTKTKHKNEDFFKKLDEDRKKKGCEYAVLVSMLETDSDLYNQGIVDVSHKYPKMYVIRPYQFITMITVLRNAAKRSSYIADEYAKLKAQSVDVASFEEKLSDFKSSFEKDVDMAEAKFDATVGEIDKAIERLEKAKAALLLSKKYFGSARKKADKFVFSDIVPETVKIIKRG